MGNVLEFPPRKHPETAESGFFVSAETAEKPEPSRKPRPTAEEVQAASDELRLLQEDPDFYHRRGQGWHDLAKKQDTPDAHFCRRLEQLLDVVNGAEGQIAQSASPGATAAVLGTELIIDLTAEY